jgi:hypothetical protein
MAGMKLLDPDKLGQAKGLATGHCAVGFVYWRDRCESVERYDRRVEDSLQLAAALEWCGDNPPGRVFLAADKKLWERRC